jgi:hypothetical protein
MRHSAMSKCGCIHNVGSLTISFPVFINQSAVALEAEALATKTDPECRAKNLSRIHALQAPRFGYLNERARGGRESLVFRPIVRNRVAASRQVLQARAIIMGAWRMPSLHFVC